MTKRVLFVSVAFPPKADPEALQTSKYFHYLQKHKDLRIDVVTSAIPTLNMPYDKDLEPYAAGADQRIFIKLKENRYFNAIIYRLGLYKKLFPDFKFSFHKQFNKVLKQLKEQPDVIYSRSDPPSSTVMAYKLKRKLNVPWILHMSDPWADCPMHNRTGSLLKKHDIWERKCFKEASIISLTSISTIEFYKKKYPEYLNKFRFFPNVFELTEGTGETLQQSRHEKFRIVYTGGLSEKRSPGALLKPLSELLAERPGMADKIEVIFAGDVDAQNRAVFQQYNLSCVNWIGKVSFKEALALQKQADLLTVIDTPISDPALSMFFPSKLLDYMVAGKRILAITTRGSATDLVMRDLKGDVCGHEEEKEIITAIVKAFEAFENGNKEYLINTVAPEKYEASFNASRLYEEIVKIS